MTNIKTITLGRRGFLLGAASTLCAPAIVRAQGAKAAKVSVGRQP